MFDNLKIVFIGGDQLRHLYYLNQIHKIFPVSSAIIENRVSGTNIQVPIPPSDLSEHDKNNFLKHFSQRFESEKVFFWKSNIT